MVAMQVSDEFVSECSSVFSRLLNENNLAVFADLIWSSVTMLISCKYLMIR